MIGKKFANGYEVEVVGKKRDGTYVIVAWSGYQFEFIVATVRNESDNEYLNVCHFPLSLYSDKSALVSAMEEFTTQLRR